MKYTQTMLLAIVSVTIPVVTCSGKSKELDNPFYCFNNGVRVLPNSPDGFEAKAALAKKIGFDGLAGRVEDYYQWRQAMDSVGLAMTEIYVKMEIDQDGQPKYPENLNDILIHSRDRDLLVALHLHNDGKIKDWQKVDKVFVEGIQKLADFCMPLGVKIAIYPHTWFHCETTSHAVTLTKAINRRNVGVVFNLCHYLKVEGSENWRESLKPALPYLFMVSINGADTGDTRNLGWDKLIQPLGEGSFDTYELVKFLKDNGYDGLFGLQCYNIKQDCEQALTKSMNTWKSYKERYHQENNSK